jgi:hypothetical protein
LAETQAARATTAERARNFIVLSIGIRGCLEQRRFDNFCGFGENQGHLYI